ncbi:Uncharacterised protein [Mycobacteroides abscessus subsp. abscessus]|nr:Uncharacterised protein [Mycobacteroides abscessus subsp. abscessus]
MSPNTIIAPMIVTPTRTGTLLIASAGRPAACAEGVSSACGLVNSDGSGSTSLPIEASRGVENP